jgi:hypothetical protein
VRAEELRRKDHIIVAALTTTRVPELGPAQDARDGSQTAAEAPVGGRGGREGDGGAEERSEPRPEQSWWRSRWFGNRTSGPLRPGPKCWRTRRGGFCDVCRRDHLRGPRRGAKGRAPRQRGPARERPRGPFPAPRTRGPGARPGGCAPGDWVLSRGHGRIQRRAVELLSADARAREEGLPFAALLPALGPDRSNARRAVRSLIRRGDAGWVTDPETGERRLKLEFWARVAAMMAREEADDDEPER